MWYHLVLMLPPSGPHAWIIPVSPFDIPEELAVTLEAFVMDNNKDGTHELFKDECEIRKIVVRSSPISMMAVSNPL